MVARARAKGFREIFVRTNAIKYAVANGSCELASLGVTGVLVPIFSHVSRVHDRIAGQPEALVAALAGIMALARAGLSIEIEVPVLDPRIQHLSKVVGLAERAVPGLRGVQFYVPRFRVPAALAPPPWSQAGIRLAEAIEQCRKLRIPATLRTTDGVPPCALRDNAQLLDTFVLERKPMRRPPHNCEWRDVCRGCAVRRFCSGVSEAYAEAHGSRDIVPYEAWPSTLPRPGRSATVAWSPERRRAASNVGLVVLRPTVNCNQDCPFCSANESSNNVWPDPDEMRRTIARTARRGVRRLSFSGGEPTLSKDLPSYVETAARLGTREIELVTNGVLLDSERRVRALTSAGLTHAFVSLHAHDETLSRGMTAKIGDFDRTVRAISLLVEHGVETKVNHVINAHNYPYLEQFVELVHGRFSARVPVSFAFITPQFMALENFHLVPKLADVLPVLRAAMYRALELGQPFVVGSRQGIPPCLLGEFQAWSDVLKMSNEALSEDASQKVRVPACESCRYTRHCTGLWKPYVSRYGADELSPVPGPPFDQDELRRIQESTSGGFGTPMSFEAACDVVRDRKAEEQGAVWLRERRSHRRQDQVRLPLVRPARSRPLRVAMLGSGQRARTLALAAQSVRGLSLDAVASPHAPDAASDAFGNCPRYRSAVEALDDIRPDCAIVAASTAAHCELALAALERNIPVLVEKPLGRTEQEAERMLGAARHGGVRLVPIHNLLYAPGLVALLDQSSIDSLVFRISVRASSPDAPLTWSRSSLYHLLYHALSVVVRASNAPIASVDVRECLGELRPERVGLMLTSGELRAVVQLCFNVAEDELTVEVAGPTPERAQWGRRGLATWIERRGAQRVVERSAGELTSMLAHFRDVVLGQAEPLATPEQALHVMRGAALALEALTASGAPFERPGPRRVRSRAL